MKRKETKPVMDAFWELLRSGIWNTPSNNSLFNGLSAEAWETIYRLVKKHAVIGTTFPALEKLPTELRPARALYLSWCGTALHIQSTNKYMQETYSKLNRRFEEKGIYPILLKGMGIAAWYPQPLLRSAGDIDLYICKQEYAATVEVLQEAGLELKRTPEHDEFVFQNVHFELHTSTSHYGDIFENNSEIVFASDGKMKYRIPTTGANALLLIKHPAKHLFTSGSAIRQLCDWAVFIQNNHTWINYNDLEDILHEDGIARFARTFTSLAVKNLGLNQATVAKSWLDASKKRQEAILLTDLLEKGDCGTSDWQQRMAIGHSSFSLAACSGWIGYYGGTLFRLLRLSTLFPEIVHQMITERMGHRLKQLAIGKPFAS